MIIVSLVLAGGTADLLSLRVQTWMVPPASGSALSGAGACRSSSCGARPAARKARINSFEEYPTQQICGDEFHAGGVSNG